MPERKHLIRCFFVAVVVLLVVDAFPMQSWMLPVKRPVALLTDVSGLRQGSWSMFTPNPVINNRWISAEMQTKDGRKLNWDSPLWSRASTWDKFVQFRHVNYYNRVHQPWCRAGRNDFLDYIARTTGEELQSIQLHWSAWT